MDRNMRSSYVNSGPRSLPHLGNKRHHNGHSSARLSPPAQPPLSNTQTQHSSNHSNTINNNNNNNNSNSQHDDLINYVYDSWNKVSREVERGSKDARYYQEVMTPRQLANFRPFNLEDWWARRLVQSINRTKHRP